MELYVSLILYSYPKLGEGESGMISSTDILFVLSEPVHVLHN